jgi:hypothetical protein
VLCGVEFWEGGVLHDVAPLLGDAGGAEHVPGL